MFYFGLRKCVANHGTQATRAMAWWFFLAISLFSCASTTTADPLSEFESLESKKPRWLFFDHRCPADVFPDHIVQLNYDAMHCARAMPSCLLQCESGQGNSCYALALHAEEKKLMLVAQALFQRACLLGIVSGCTNSASYRAEKQLSCAIKTYDMACARNDPWGCTMFGTHLSHGDGVARNPELARRVLEKSCDLMPDFEACNWAKVRLDELNELTRP